MPFGDAFGEVYNQDFKKAPDQHGERSPVSISTKDDSYTLTFEDIDEAIVDWFEKHQPIVLEDPDGNRKNTPVIFATAERYEMYQRSDGVRDEKTNQAILPVISIKQSGFEGIAARTIPTAEDGSSDMLIKRFPVQIKDGLYLPYSISAYNNNFIDNPEIFMLDITTVQPAKWTKVTYDGVAWTQTMVHMNFIKEHLLHHFNQMHSIFTSKGHSLFAMAESYAIQNNDEDLAGEERSFKTQFTITVEAPLIEKVRQTQRHQTSTAKLNIETEVVLGPLDKKFDVRYDPYKIQR